MNMTLIPARTTKFIGVGVLAVSLLVVSTGCASGGTEDSAPVAAASATATATPTPTAEAKKVLETQFVRVIDGDTIEVQPVTKGAPNGEPSLKVHMLGVSAPDAAACGGADAIARLKSLFRPNEFVHVTYEPTLDKSVDQDGNTLAYAITGAGVQQDVGGRMIKEGFASASYPEGATTPERFERYVKQGKSAAEQKDGIWASCPAPKV